MEASHILLVHYERGIRDLAAAALAQDNLRLSLACSEDEGLSVLGSQRVHVLLTDAATLGIGDEFVRRAATIQPFLRIVQMVDAALLNQVSTSKQNGSIQYLARPITNESLRQAVQRAIIRCTPLSPEGRVVEKTATNASDGRDVEAVPIIAASKAMREILKLARRCATTDASVLIHGEPDTGKELLAREIHRLSRRCAGPFVRVACSALRDAELAERLFGQGEHEADSGDPVSPTFLEKARGGTLFLDNVSHLPQWSQFKLLDALQHQRGAFTGSGVDAAIDVRIIASTTADLHAAAAQQAFLSSLYYYLSVVQIHVPPLRQRPEDIQQHAEAYLAIANATRVQHENHGPCRFSREAMQCLLEYHWPGNNRQLASVVAHVALLANDPQIAQAAVSALLGEVVRQGDCDTIAVPLVGGLKEMERSIIEAVVERCRGNKTAAARTLRLHRRTLYRMLEDQAPGKTGALPVAFDLGPRADGCGANTQF